MIGEKIKMIREFRNYSQQYLANKLHMSQNSYSRIELGKSKVNSELLENVSIILDINLEDLLSKENPIIVFQNKNILDKYHYEHIIQILQEELNSAIRREEKLISLLEKMTEK